MEGKRAQGQEITIKKNKKKTMDRSIRSTEQEGWKVVYAGPVHPNSASHPSLGADKLGDNRPPLQQEVKQQVVPRVRGDRRVQSGPKPKHESTPAIITTATAVI